MTVAITRITVAARQGDNGMPLAGQVTFSDGKSYGWGMDDRPRNPSGVLFIAERLKDSRAHSFMAPQRAQAVKAALGL